MTDYKIMESVHMKVLEENAEAQQKAQKDAEKQRWKGDKDELMKFAG